MTNWIIVGGIFLIAAVSGVLYWLSRISNPPVDQSGIEMPLSGWTNSSVVDAYTRSERSLKHAHDQHHFLEKIIGWFLEQLKKVKIPYVDPERKGIGAVILILIFIVICIISFACIASGFAGRVLSMIPKDLVVQAGQTCTGIRNGQTVLLPEGTELIIDQDICDGAIVVARTQVPTQQVPTTPAPAGTETAPVSEVNQSAPQNEQPQTLVLSPVPAPVSGKYFVIQISDGVTTTKYGSWGPLQPGSESYFSLIQTSTCGQPFSVPTEYAEYLVYALVDVNVDMYGPEVVSDGQSMSIACSGNILLVIDPPAVDQ